MSQKEKKKSSLKRRAAAYLFGTVFAVLALTIGLVQSSRFEAYVCGQIEAQAGAYLGAKVDIDHVQIRLLTLQPRVELFDVEVFPRLPGKTIAEEPSLEAEIVRVVVRPLQLWARRLDIDRVELEGPHLDLVQKDGKWIGLPPGLFIEAPVSDGPAEPQALAVRLDAFVVKRGTLHLSAETSDLQLGLTEIDALGTLEANGTVVVDFKADGRRVMMKVGQDWFEEFIDSVGGQVIVSSSSIEVRGASLVTDSLSVEVDGQVGLGAKTDVVLSRLHAIAPLEFVQRIVPEAPALSGEIDWTGSLVVDGSNFRARGNAAIDDFRLERFHFGATEAEIEVLPDRARAKRMKIAGAGGSVEGPLEIAWANQNVTLDAKLAVAGASFARLLHVLGIDGAVVDSRLDGRVAFAGGVSPLSIQGTADLAHADFTWRDRAWDAPGAVTPNLRLPGGTLQGGFAVTEEGVEFRKVAMTTGTSGLTLEGDLFFRGATDLRFQAAPIALGEISPIAGVALAGTGPAAGSVSGPFDDLVVAAELDLDGMKVAGFDFGRATGEIRFSAKELTLESPGTSFVRGKSRYGGRWKIDFAEPALDVAARVESGSRIEDLADIVFSSLPASQYAQGTVSAGAITLKGPFDRLNGAFEASGKGLDVSGERFASYRAKGRWRDGAIWLDDLVATRASGAQLFARGSLGVAPADDPQKLGAPVNLELHTSKWTLAELDFLGPDPILTSDIRLRLHLGGHLYRPEISGRLNLDDTKLYGQPLDASQLDFRPWAARPFEPETKDRVRIWGTLAGGTITSEATIHLKSATELPFELKLLPKRHSIKPYFMAFNPRLAKDPEVKAYLGGSIEVNGDLRDPAKTSVNVNANQLSLSRGPHRIYNKVPIVVSTGPGGQLELKSVVLAGDETEFTLAGYSRNGYTDISAHGHLDLAFAELLTEVFTRVEGTLTIPDTDAERFRIRGPSNALTWGGTALIEKGTFKTRFFTAAAPEDITARVKISSQAIEIESLQGKLGGGQVEGKGEILLSPSGGIQRWNLGPFKLSGVNMRFPSYALNARVSGPLQFTGSGSGQSLPELGGDLQVEELKYSGPIEWKSSTVRFKAGPTLVPVSNEDSKLFKLNITLRADDDVWVRNDIGRIEFRIDPSDPLRVVGDNTAWGVKGTLQLKGGTIVTFDREFTLTNATIVFDDDKQVDLSYDITADTFIRDWQVTLHVKGKRSRGQPHLEFSSNPPLSEEDVKFLLTAGATGQELRASGQEVAAAGALAATTLGAGLGEQRGVTSRLKKVFNLDTFDVVPYTEGNGSIGVKSVGRGTLTDDLSYNVSFGLSDRTTFSVQGDYRLSRRIHVVFGWTNEQQTSSSEQQVINEQGEFSADTRFRFEWK